MKNKKNTPTYTPPTPSTVPTTVPTQVSNKPKYIVTHDSKTQQRAPHTEVVYDIDQWIKDNNNTLFVLYLTKL
jgi:hypothetical protein